MLEEHNFLILTSSHVLNLRFITYMCMLKNITLSNAAWNHVSMIMPKYFVYRWQMNITVELFSF